MLKQGREVKTHISDVFRTSYGTVDMSSLKSIFLNLSTWAEPVEEKECWVRPIKKFKNHIKNTVHRQLSYTPFKDIAIVDLDLRASGVKQGKRSFMKCEVTLFLDSKQKYNIKSTEISSPITNLTTSIIKDSLLPSTIFKFHTTKKDKQSKK